MQLSPCQKQNAGTSQIDSGWQEERKCVKQSTDADKDIPS